MSTEKLYDVDETENPYGFYGNMRKPFTIMTMLASKSVPGNVSGRDATAGYFFFETQQGFRFKSIDSLIRNEPFDTKYTYAPGIIDSNDGTKDFKILEFSTSKNQNLLENLDLQEGEYDDLIKKRNLMAQHEKIFTAINNINNLR